MLTVAVLRRWPTKFKRENGTKVQNVTFDLDFALGHRVPINLPLAFVKCVLFFVSPNYSCYSAANLLIATWMVSFWIKRNKITFWLHTLYNLVSYNWRIDQRSVPNFFESFINERIFRRSSKKLRKIEISMLFRRASKYSFAFSTSIWRRKIYVLAGLPSQLTCWQIGTDQKYQDTMFKI